MTMAPERPAEVRAGDGGVPARRAVVRWAWRLFRREWRQQLLVLTLIAVAVAATIVSAAVATNTPPPADTGFGSANHLVVLQGTDPHLVGDIAAIKAHFGTADVIENEQIATGLVGGAQLRAQDPHGPFGSSMLALVSGHYPRGAVGVALTSQLASTFGLRLGDVWHEAGRSLRVVGIVENPQDLLDKFALVAPGQLDSPSQVTVLFDATEARVARFTFPQGAIPETPQHSSGISPAIVVLVVAILGLIFIGLVVAASFAVLGQRRLRSLGMLSSLGATDGNVRLVMVANGAVVGITGALIGAVIGLAAWIAYAPSLSVSAHHRVAWTSLPWWMIVTALALAVATAVLASLRPARAVAHTSVVAALSGRPAPPKAMHRSALPGIGLLVVGLLLLAFSGGLGATGGRPLLFTLGGIVAVAAGLLLLAPVAIAALAVVARRPSIAARIALRDLIRYRTRSAADWRQPASRSSSRCSSSCWPRAALPMPSTTSGRTCPQTSSSSMRRSLGPTGGGGPGPAAPDSQQRTAELQRRASAIAAALDSHDLLALDVSSVFLQEGSRQGDSSNPLVATPALLRHYGIDPGGIGATTLLITSRPGLQDASGLRLMYAVGNQRTSPGLPTFMAFRTRNPDLQQPAHLHLGPQPPGHGLRRSQARAADDPSGLAHPTSSAAQCPAGQQCQAGSRCGRHDNRDEEQRAVAGSASHLRDRGGHPARPRCAGDDRRPDPRRDRR